MSVCGDKMYSSVNTMWAHREKMHGEKVWFFKYDVSAKLFPR